MWYKETVKANILKHILYLRSLYPKRNYKALFTRLYDPNQSDELKAFSVAFGVFLGILPIWGFQTLAAISFSIVFKMNKALVLIFSHISLPPFLPLIIFLSYRAGNFWMGKSTSPIPINTQSIFQNFNSHLQQYIYGSITLAFAAAITSGLVTFILLKSIKVIKQYKLPYVVKKGDVSVSN